MGLAKEIMMQDEARKAAAIQRKRDGYRKYLLNNGNYSDMDCPYCEGALSNQDFKAAYCLHCNYTLPWNRD